MVKDGKGIMSVVAELDQIISLLEAEIPASISSPQNQRLAARLEKDLAKYFKSLGDAFPYSKLDKLYSKYVTESLGTETESILEALIKAFGSGLVTMLEGHLTTIYLDGVVQMVSWGKTKAGIPITYEGPPIEKAVTFAEKQGAKLVTQMNEETKRRLAQVVSDGIKNKRGIPGLSRDIRKSFTDMSRYRSQVIARTETSSALSQASLDKMKDMEIEGKEWIWPGGECDICADCAASGVVPLDFEFPHYGDDPLRPPAHPNCVCSLSPAILRK